MVNFSYKTNSGVETVDFAKRSDFIRFLANNLTKIQDEDFVSLSMGEEENALKINGLEELAQVAISAADEMDKIEELFNSDEPSKHLTEGEQALYEKVLEAFKNGNETITFTEKEVEDFGQSGFDDIVYNIRKVFPQAGWDYNEDDDGVFFGKEEWAWMDEEDEDGCRE